MHKHIGLLALIGVASMTYRQEGTEASGTVQVKPNFNQNVDLVDSKYFFKKVTDEAGNTTKRPTLEIKIPRPSVEGIKFILENANTPEGAKSLELLYDAVYDVVSARARQLLNDVGGESLTSENFPIDKLGWAAIANLPKSDRRESAIDKETWEEFAKDYIAIMPALTSKKLEQVAMAAKVFLKKFRIGDIATDKNALKLLKGQLALYLTNTTKAEEMMDLVDWLDKKADALIIAEPLDIASAL